MEKDDLCGRLKPARTLATLVRLGFPRRIPLRPYEVDMWMVAIQLMPPGFRASLHLKLSV